MEELLKELQERLEYLENRKEQTTITNGRIAELLLVIVRIQQILLEDINKP